MRIFKFCCLIVSLIISENSISMEKNLYNITFKDLSDNSIKISDYKDKVILFSVNKISIAINIKTEILKYFAKILKL